MIEKVLEAYSGSSALSLLQRKIYLDMHNIRLISNVSSAKVREFYEKAEVIAICSIHSFESISSWAVQRTEMGESLTSLYAKLAFDMSLEEDGKIT